MLKYTNLIADENIVDLRPDGFFSNKESTRGVDWSIMRCFTHMNSILQHSTFGHFLEWLRLGSCVKVTRYNDGLIAGYFRYLLPQCLGTFHPGDPSSVVEVGIEKEKCSFCFLVSQLSPGSRPGIECIPAFTFFHIGRFRQAERTCIQSLKAVFSRKNGGVFPTFSFYSGHPIPITFG